MELALHANNSMMAGGVDDTVRAPRRSHNVTTTGLSSAHSHAALSTTLNQVDSFIIFILITSINFRLVDASNWILNFMRMTLKIIPRCLLGL